jgi:hypothetical protein
MLTTEKGMLNTMQLDGVMLESHGRCVAKSLCKTNPLKPSQHAKAVGQAPWSMTLLPVYLHKPLELRPSFAEAADGMQPKNVFAAVPGAATASDSRGGSAPRPKQRCSLEGGQLFDIICALTFASAVCSEVAHSHFLSKGLHLKALV